MKWINHFQISQTNALIVGVKTEKISFNVEVV